MWRGIVSGVDRLTHISFTFSYLLPLISLSYYFLLLFYALHNTVSPKREFHDGYFKLNLETDELSYYEEQY